MLNTSGPRRVVQIFTVTGDNSDTLEENLSGSETEEASTPGEINRQSSVIIIQTPAAVNGFSIRGSNPRQALSEIAMNIGVEATQTSDSEITPSTSNGNANIEAETIHNIDTDSSPSTNISVNDGKEDLQRPSSSVDHSHTNEHVDDTTADLTIKLKFLDDTQKQVKAWLSTTVGEFKRKYFSDFLMDGKVVRLIYKGQLLRDDSKTLVSYGIHDECVVHCHVGTTPYRQQTNAGAPGNVPNLNRRNTNTGFAPPNFIGGRPIITGFAWIDIILLACWNAFLFAYGWIQTSDPIEDNPQHPWALRVKNAIRRYLRTFLNFVYQPINENDTAEDPYRFNVGNLMILLFIIKFSTLWLFVMYFPQFVDFKGVFCLTLVTVFFAFFTFFSRAAAPVNRMSAG
uniref:Ubiquitin-like domain-containing protein n=1 Tax=Acrobeloides nanus TaxID=290746 RepID=A0A914DJB3_9BILA